MFNFICIQSVAHQLICQNCQIDQSTPSRFSVVNRCMLADIYKKYKCQNVDRSTTGVNCLPIVGRCRGLFDGVFNDCFNQTNRPSSQEKLQLGLTDTKLVGRRQKEIGQDNSWTECRPNHTIFMSHTVGYGHFKNKTEVWNKHTQSLLVMTSR